jgi:Polysaccharide lyase
MPAVAVEKPPARRLDAGIRYTPHCHALMLRLILAAACLVLGAAAAAANNTGDVRAARNAPPPSSADALSLAGVAGSARKAFSCTFAKSPTECGFKVQEKVPGRASIVGFGRDGGRALRLHTRPGDDNVHGSGHMRRTDVYLAHSGGAPIVYHEGEEQVWELSIMFPDDFTFPRWHVYALANFHHEGRTGANIFEFGFRKDPTGDLKPGILAFRGAAGNTSASPAVRYQSAAVSSPQRNVWYDLVFHVKWSSGADGFFHAWVNGEKRLAHDGPTLFVGEGVYLKLANYHVPVCDPYPACKGRDPPSSVIYDRIIRHDVRR